MHAVRRVLTTAGLAGLLTLASAGSAWAVDAPNAEPSAAPSATASPTASTGPSEEPLPEPTGGGCEENPVICQSGQAPGGSVDCPQVEEGGVASPPPDGVFCITTANPEEVTPVSAGEGAGAGAPETLPRTGPAPLLPTLALGSWLVLFGVLVTLAARRRTACS